jgi:putative DNA primase/helicase
MLQKKSSKAKRDSAEPVNQGTHTHTSEAKCVGVGTSEKRGKFLLVAKGNKRAVLSVRNLTRQPTEELERLEALDVEFILPAARNRFLQHAQAAASMEPSFKVATQIGWFGDVFVTPSDVYPKQVVAEDLPLKGWPRIQAHLDAKDDDVHSRFRCSGSASKSQELFRLCHGNSRLMFAAALSFVGPCCKPFKLRAPGFQFVGEAASGKTTVGVVAGAAWGGNPDSSLGFGSAWNGTVNGLEEYAPAHHQTLMVLDETSLMPTDEKGRMMSFGEALMRLMQGQGKKRFNSRVIERWSAPFISTSNFSVFRLLDSKRKEQYGAYVDRLMDIPAPRGSASFFENLHGFADADALSIYLFDLAANNFGHPSRAFLQRLTAELSRDRAALCEVVAACVEKYKEATAGVTSSKRNLMRVRGYFATVYAAGCLAIRYKILRFTETELLDAVLTCHRDHVAFIDQELGVAGTPANAPGSVAAPAGLVVVTEQPFARLKRYINDNSKRDFFDLRKPKAKLPKGAAPKGYVATYGGHEEYWLTDADIEAVAGSKTEARDLKAELAVKGLIATERRGKSGISYVVKRPVPGVGRTYVVAVRAHKPKGGAKASPAS